MSNWILQYYKDSFNRGAKQGKELKEKHKKIVKKSTSWVAFIVVILLVLVGTYILLTYPTISEEQIPNGLYPVVNVGLLTLIVGIFMIVTSIIVVLANRGKNNEENKKTN